MLPNSNDLIYFLELYNVKNISRAAERLGITQPSLSVSLQRLESSLNLKLFSRSKSGIQPTKEAEILAKEVELLIDEWQRIGNKAKQAKNLVKGNIKIGCHASVALYAVFPWLQKLLKAHKDLEFSFIHDLSRKVAEQIISYKIDLGLVINPVQHPDLVITKLLTDEVNFRCAKKYDAQTLIYDPSLGQAQLLLQNIKKRQINFTRHITTSSLELVELLTSQGVGVGILPERVCKSELQVFDSKIKSVTDQLCLIYRYDLPGTNSFQAVIESIKTNFMS